MTPKKISCPNGIRTGHAALYRERIWRLPTDAICGCMTWRVENVSSRVSMTRRNIVQIRRMRLHLMKRQKNVFLAFGNEWEYAEPSASESKEGVLKIRISTGEKSRVATEKAKKICAVSEKPDGCAAYGMHQ